MAKSMIKRRQEAERARIDGFTATLKRVSHTARQAPDFEQALAEAARGLDDLAIREAADWRPKLKTRDPGRLLLAAARHLYARYPVPAHLDAVWLDYEGLADETAMVRKRWYVTVASGGSLYKACASPWLSRKEVHAFLTAPAGLDFLQAFWFAVATGMKPDAASALRIARSKIARTSTDATFDFWRNVVQLFVGTGSTVEQIDDLCDYLGAMVAADATYSVKGRTIGSLSRASHQWHREVALVARIEAIRRRYAGTVVEGADGGRWKGSPLANWSWRPPGEEAKRAREDYQMVQLTSSAELVAESSAMRHCVWTYAGKCIAGEASIWSLRRRDGKAFSRMLTVEVDRYGKAVQVRGLANRTATTDERRVLDRWARASGVAL